MFDYHQSIKSDILNSIGLVTDYRIICTAWDCFTHGYLFKEDIEEIQEALNKKNNTNYTITEPSRNWNN